MTSPVMINDSLNNQANYTEEILDYNDLHDTFKFNWQVNSNYEISFTATYAEQYKDAWNMLKMKRSLWFDGQLYYIQQAENVNDENGMLTLKVTANAALIDLMKNVRLDPKQPTEDNPDVGGTDSSSDSSSSGSGQQQQASVVVKKTDEQQTYTLQNRLDQFFNGNDQGIKYELHGNFPQAAVDCSGSLYEWLGQNLATFGAYWIPDNYVLKIYDRASLAHQTDLVFRYLNNSTNVDIQMDGNGMINDCDVYGGKMEKDITEGSGGGGNLDSVEGFAKSQINASFGVNKAQMCADFANRSQKVRARGVDVNKLYDTVKSAGVSPEWFFAYELQEQNSNMGWLNHWSYPHGDPYNDATVVCGWIKSTANTDYLHPAWGAAEGSIGANSGLEAKWNAEFGKNTIGRVYLQGTAAAVWELAGQSGNSYIGRPLQGCVNQIRVWGGHTVTGGGGWGWPFPSVGEGKFSGDQLFGVHPGGEFRPNNFHDGLDFGSIDHPGSEVHAIHGGKVTISRDYVGGVGYYVVIQDSSGLNVEYQEAFGSPSNIIVNVGDTVQTGQVIGYRTTDHLHIGITRHSFREAFSHAWSNDGTWLDPQAMIKQGGNGGGDDSGTTTTSETYYALYFHYRDEDSIKKYGLHRGPQITMDSIYDMNALKAYVENTVQHDPATTVTNNEIGEGGFHIGDVARLIVPERQLDEKVMLMGISYNPFNLYTDASLTWDNTGLAMKSSIYAIYQDIKQVNNNISQLDLYGATGARHEDHFSNIDVDRGNGKKPSQGKTLTKSQMERVKEFTNS